MLDAKIAQLFTVTQTRKVKSLRELWKLNVPYWKCKCIFQYLMCYSLTALRVTVNELNKGRVIFCLS